MVKFWKTMGVPGGIATILLLIGGINWGLVGLNGSWNLVTNLINTSSFVHNIIYILIGLSAIYSAYALFIRKK